MLMNAHDNDSPIRFAGEAEQEDDVEEAEVWWVQPQTFAAFIAWLAVCARG